MDWKLGFDSNILFPDLSMWAFLDDILLGIGWCYILHLMPIILSSLEGKNSRFIALFISSGPAKTSGSGPKDLIGCARTSGYGPKDPTVCCFLHFKLELAYLDLSFSNSFSDASYQVGCEQRWFYCWSRLLLRRLWIRRGTTRGRSHRKRKGEEDQGIGPTFSGSWSRPYFS